MNPRRFFGIALLCLSSAVAISAQDTPSDLRDLVGARAAGGETQLQNRGYEFVKTTEGTDRKWSNWWNNNRRQCITVATVNGRYDSIVTSPSFDCNRSDSGDTGNSGGNDQAPSDVRDLIGARASSGETQLRNRGYQFVKTQKGAGRIYSNWWHNGRRVCLNVVTMNGRYDTIMTTGSTDCNRNGGGSSSSDSMSDWKLIGSVVATTKIKSTTFFVPSKYRNVRRLRVKALNSTIKIWSMRIHFQNGQTQKLTNLDMIPQNVNSDVIELEQDNGIKSIFFSINAVSFSKKTAVLWIYGQQ